MALLVLRQQVAERIVHFRIRLWLRTACIRHEGFGL
jgi:hypothetical protein